MAVRRLLLLSSSTVHPSGFLEYAKGHIKSFLGPQIKKVLFIPYALHDHDGKVFFLVDPSYKNIYFLFAN
jgi:peptidase E